MVKHKGLGRGLDALLGGGAEESASGELRTLPVTALQPGKYQPRTRMDPESLGELAESIKVRGIMQPILARGVPGGRYEIIAGERRWRAAQLAGLVEVPTLVRDVPDEAALAMALIENIQRENLNPIEEATGIQRLTAEFGMTHEQAAGAVGRSRSAVSNLLRLLNLAAPVQEMVLNDQLDMGHARALLTLPPSKQTEAAHQIVVKGLSVREAERLATRLAEVRRTSKPRRDPDIARLEEELSDRLGAPVSIQAGRGGRGKLVVSYASLDDLDRIVAAIR